MAKTLYSLMLDDYVVNEIDRMAHRDGLTRSAEVNRILADYASVVTPEKRINDIFSYIDSIFGGDGDIIPTLIPNQSTMMLKSSLDFRYRPTVKYEVELEKIPHGSIGTLSVIFRTQSAELLGITVNFFRLWKTLEDKYLPMVGVKTAEYSLTEGRFERSISLPERRDMTSEDIADAISNYINIFDRIMKSYVEGGETPAEIEEAYLEYLKKGVLII